MPNRNYEKGRRKEYKICNELKEEGWDIVQRTAGSHSPFDIIAVHKEDKKIGFIQAKPEDFHKSKIIEEYNWLNGEFTVEFWVE